MQSRAKLLVCVCSVLATLIICITYIVVSKARNERFLVALILRNRYSGDEAPSDASASLFGTRLSSTHYNILISWLAENRLSNTSQMIDASFERLFDTDFSGTHGISPAILAKWAFEALGTNGEPYVNDLVALLPTRNSPENCVAAAIAATGRAGCLALVSEFDDTQDGNIRHQIVTTLSNFVADEPELVDFFAACVTAQESTIRYWAVHSLSKVPKPVPPEVVSALKVASEDEDADTRELARKVLNEFATESP